MAHAFDRSQDEHIPEACRQHSNRGHGPFKFAAIVEPERLEFVSSFADASGSIIRAPFDANWPLETQTSVVFEPHAGIGRGTVVTLRAAALTEKT